MHSSGRQRQWEGGGGDVFHGAQIKKKTSCQSFTKLNKVFKQIPSRFNTRIFHVYGQKIPSNPFSLTVCLFIEVETSFYDVANLLIYERQENLRMWGMGGGGGQKGGVVFHVET